MTEKRNRPLSSVKREGIVACAGALFLKHGYDPVSMDMIAAAVPVSKPTLYNHFSSKEALYRAIMEERCIGLSRIFDDILKEGTDIRATLTRIGAHFLDRILKPESVGMYRIMIGESAKFPELGQIFFDTGPKRVQTLLTDYFKVQVKAGAIDMTEPGMAAHMFINMIKGHAQMKVLLAVDKAPDAKKRAKMVAYAVDVFLKGHGFKD